MNLLKKLKNPGNNKTAKIRHNSKKSKKEIKIKSFLLENKLTIYNFNKHHEVSLTLQILS
jgi:hypothetical protein